MKKKYITIITFHFKISFNAKIFISDNKRKEITGIQPQVFRKVLDYLFKGSVPLR